MEWRMWGGLWLSKEKATILAFPDYTEAFTPQADASSCGFRAVLAQSVGGKEQVVAFTGRTLTKLSIVTVQPNVKCSLWVHHFCPHLYGKPFSYLKWLPSFKQVAQIFEEYQFTVEHRPGNKHSNADALSRIPCKQCGWQDKLEETSVKADANARHLHGHHRSCAHCNRLTTVCTLLSSGWSMTQYQLHSVMKVVILCGPSDSSLC